MTVLQIQSDYTFEHGGVIPCPDCQLIEPHCHSIKQGQVVIINPNMPTKRIKTGFIAAWYDFWIGAFYDRRKHRLYIMILPCIGFWIELS